MAPAATVDPQVEAETATHDAEPCSRISFALTHGTDGSFTIGATPTRICPERATHEVLVYCPGCARSPRRVFCHECTELVIAWAHEGLPCIVCQRMSVHLIAVNPL